MPMFTVTFTNTVEADTAEEAIRRADETGGGHWVAVERGYDDADRIASTCGCGYPLSYFGSPDNGGDGWQHIDAPALWGDDHDPRPTPEDADRAAQWDLAHPEGL